VVGLGAALAYVESIGHGAIAACEQELLAHASDALRAIPGLRIFGEARHKVPVISFLIDGVHAHDLATLLDHAGIAMRSGHHCAHPLMQFYGVPATLRMSLAFYNTHAEIDRAVEAIVEARRLLA
jgi:cysteine desulfurase/selenocysteine lyase